MQPVWRVVFAERKFVDATSRFPFSEAAPKIALHACRRLVTLLGGLGEQLHDDRRDGAWDIFYRSLGGGGCLAIWQCTHSIGSAAVKGRPPVSIS